MRVGLFALEVGRNVGGLEIYETELIRALGTVDHENEYCVFCLDERVPQILGVLGANFRFEVLPVNRFKGVIWDAPRAMARAGLDLFHAMFVPPPFTSVPYVFTHHGSEVLERPEFYPWALGLRIRLLVRRGLARAGIVVCVSNYVRHYLATERKIAMERLRTVYHGCRPEFRPREQTEAREFVGRRYGIRERFLLFVGRIEPRKNPVRVLRAYDQFRRSVPNPPHMIFAGEKNWGGPEFDRVVAELRLKPFIHELGHVPHEDLPMIYAAAEAVVFASLWEGFGLPAIEAMATGTPLIAARTTSLPEVTDGACRLVDPSSVTDMAAAMSELYSDTALREQLVRLGRVRAERFNWSQTAKETIQVYRELAAAKKRT